MPQFQSEFQVHNHSNGKELRIPMQIKPISLTIAELRNRDKQQLGNGLVCTSLPLNNEL